jgi:hypothetical protein
MPTPTDLVTDLPADFEVFGQAVATSLADLLGGTSGQILAKNSNTDMDFVWIANDQGDITGITASSPLTGGGTSGAITVGIQDALTTQKGAVQLSDSTSTTSSILAATPTAVKAAYDLADGAIAKTTLTTAGDVIYRNATVPVRLGIGTAGQVLTVNSGATAPEWATPAGGTPTYVGVSLATSANQTISNSTSTALVWDQENFDTDGFHSNVTNNTRVTIPAGKAGKYQVNLLGSWYNNSTNVRVLAVYVNGTVFKGVKMQAQTEEQSQVIALTLSLSVGDYVEGYVFQNSGASRVFYGSGDQGHMSLNYLGA